MDNARMPCEMAILNSHGVFTFKLEEPVVLQQDSLFASSASLSRSFNFKHFCPFRISVFFLWQQKSQGLGQQAFFTLHEPQDFSTDGRLCCLYKIKIQAIFPDNGCPKLFSSVKCKESKMGCTQYIQRDLHQVTLLFGNMIFSIYICVYLIVHLHKLAV